MLGRTLLTTATVTAVAVILTSPASAADSPGDPGTGTEVASYLHSVRPSVIVPGDELVLGGVVENTGDEPLENIQVLPRWSDVQLETREEIGRVSSDPSIRWGLRHDDPYEVVTERLEPGQSREFELSFDNVDQLGFGLAGVYAIGVDIRGTISTGERVTLDTVRTVIPWMPTEPPPVPMAMLWPVEAPPSLLPDGALRNDALADRLAPDGPLGAIVEAADSSPLTWLVDPDVLDTVDSMTDGYETGPDPADREQGESSDLASSWRSAFNQESRNGSVSLLPYARPDAEALLAADTDLAATLMARSLEASRETAGDMDDAQADVVRPGSGETSERMLSMLARAGVGTVILPQAGVTPAPRHPRAQLVTPEGELDAVLTDTGLDAALLDAYTAPNPEAGALDLRQRWAAETAMAALEAETLGIEPAPMIVAPPPRWTPGAEVASAIVDAWTSIPWVEPVTLDGISPPDQAEPVTTIPAEAVNALPAENVDATALLQAASRDYTDLLAEPEPELITGLGRAVLRAASTGWRDDPAAGTEYASSITDELRERLDEVRVTVPESVTLSSRTGIFPLTVTNDLDEPVTVTLAIEAANPDRLRVTDLEEQRVEAGARETVEVQAEAATNGRVPITVQLVTRNQSPLGPATQTVVNATDYGTIGWVIIAGAGALFGASVLRTSLRRRRAGPEDTDTDAATSGEEADVPDPGDVPRAHAPGVAP
ncbi:hypothetical protein G1H11_09155 [Phytoactinopolyspora alkaliphila]|uniref:DUF11 domain-containing protein n=1 Tax=Phytoactinopolyspora alkaliphila TaxID=1783498 RepID=A0A6N9YKP1_9ACTN|nr:DUF6049 family protein [Phytoactinopolyspora alkaliphila]NED95480.1 hypothetical protein [Phytoactinopolyspora alkaliphila]